MQDEVRKPAHAKLDELKLRDDLRALRRQIPDTPALNPIVSVAFDLSRRLEAGEITFEELKALASRLMDRACVERARELRARDGFVDPATTLKEFSAYIEQTAKDADFEAFKARWERARTGIVLTAHPTFGLVGRAVAPHRRDRGLRWRRRQADRHCRTGPTVPSRSSTSTPPCRPRSATCAMPTSSCSTASMRSRLHATATRRGSLRRGSRRSRPGWATISTGARTSSGPSRFSIRLREKQAALNDIRDRFLALKSDVGSGAEVQRLSRQLTGKLDLAIAAVDEQIAALDQIGPGGFTLARGRQRDHARRTATTSSPPSR